MHNNIAWQVAKKHLWILRSIREALECEKPRLLRSCDISKENKTTKSTFYRELKFLEDNKFVIRARARTSEYYLITQKGNVALNLEATPEPIEEILHFIYSLTEKEG